MVYVHMIYCIYTHNIVDGERYKMVFLQSSFKEKLSKESSLSKVCF